jgi:hypothetical protein
MENTRLIRSLKKLDKKQVKSFREYIAWPYINTNEDVIVFFNIIIKYYPEFAVDTLSNDALAKKLGTPKAYKREYIIRLSYLLLDLLEQFIYHEWSIARPVLRDIALVEWNTNEVHLPDLNAYLKRAIETIETSQLNLYEKYYWRYYLTFITGIYNGNIENVYEADYFEQIYRRLNTFYISNNLYFGVLERSNNMSVSVSDLGVKNLEAQLQLLKGSYDSDNPHIKLWTSLLDVYLNTSMESYIQVKQTLLSADNHYLSHFERANVFYLLENISKEIFSMPNDHLQNVYDLYKMQIASGDILYRNKLNVHVFRNIVTVYIKVNQLDEAMDFVKQYSQYLPTDNLVNDNVLEISRAMIRFEQGKYAEAQDHLNLVTMRNIHVKLDERRIRMKVYYMTGQLELLLALVGSFRKLLSDYRDEISEQPLALHREFINYVHEIMHLHKGDESKIQDICTRLAVKPVLERSWLLACAKQLMAKPAS